MNPQRDFEIVKQQLNRNPDGFQEVVRRVPDGSPAIIRVASVVNGAPFPTLFWVSDPGLAEMIHRYESNGVTQTIQELVDQDDSFRHQLIEDNKSYINKRAEYFDEQVIETLERLGIKDEFSAKGIGGVRNLTRVRCLHAYLGAHAVMPNLVGKLLAIQYGMDDPLVIALSRLN